MFKLIDALNVLVVIKSNTFSVKFGAGIGELGSPAGKLEAKIGDAK